MKRVLNHIKSKCQIRVKMILLNVILVLFFSCNLSYAIEDPWFNLRKQYEKKSQIKKIIKKEQQDPWKLLRAVYLPFSISEEKKAAANPVIAKVFIKKFNSRIVKYNAIIKRAAKMFDIPKEIIKAVIMAESGGDNFAKAKTTSAKGLMQTIDSTFKMARAGLAKNNVFITDDPFDPESSIMAGAWYLDRMYGKCISDGKIVSKKRGDITSWRYPLEYYYAGPLHGKKKKNKIYVFSNGKRRMIDKRIYSRKIEKWAQILAV